MSYIVAYLSMEVVIRESREKQTFVSTSVYTADVDYFMSVIRVYSAAFVPKEFRLTGRELECLACVYQSIAAGERNILDMLNIRKYFRSFKDKRTVQVWLPKLIAKGWVAEKDERYGLLYGLEKLITLKQTGFVIDIVANGK